MKNKSKPVHNASNPERRHFIRTSTIVGAGVAAAAVASTSVIADVSAPASDKAEQKGYQLTQHVLDYYKSAGV